ncbi:hypothetical protein BDV93DRAFT_526898 [Ceratobasidium sp. AG-I]|nr:hypothetical protein BDV93DRAFT_526898 [Ceratobasidium sp. AG-I]
MSRDGSTHRIFEVPELLASICSYSSIAQCTRLARVSRLFFNTSVPFVWKETVAVHNVLRLFSGVKLSIKPAEGMTYKRNYKIVCFPLAPCISSLKIQVS